MLRWYAEHFDTVEINSSFYRLPSSPALDGWLRETPGSFCFAVKASSYITHNRKLKDPRETVERFMKVVEKLKPRLGPILFQLPPSWKVNVERLDAFLAGLPPSHHYVFEFRNQSWNVQQVYDVLRRRKAAFCMYELGGFQSPMEITADFTYVRLHGPGNKYQGDYSVARLRGWAKRIEQWQKQLRDIFVYFDNDQAGFAAKNSLELNRMILGVDRHRAAS
jgi:uncharacterized protein YecE (DUF72 family)